MQLPILDDLLVVPFQKHAEHGLRQLVHPNGDKHLPEKLLGDAGISRQDPAGPGAVDLKTLGLVAASELAQPLLGLALQRVALMRQLPNLRRTSVRVRDPNTKTKS